MNGLLAVAGGGALGAVLRYALTLLFPASLFPWAILGINIAGSFLIGLMMAWWAELEWFQNWGRLFLVVGILGGFTTFSAFSLETLLMIQQQRLLQAGGYILGSVMGCLLAVAAGVALAGASGSITE